jgi:hypothetical protein
MLRGACLLAAPALVPNYGALASAAIANTQSNVATIATRGKWSASIDVA